jgi:hypothetical protein
MFTGPDVDKTAIATAIPMERTMIIATLRNSFKKRLRTGPSILFFGNGILGQEVQVTYTPD